MIPASTIAELATLGLSKEQTLAVARMLREVEDATIAAAPPIETRSAAAVRQERYRRNKASQNITNRNSVTESDACYVDVTQGLPQVSPDGSPQRDIIKPLSLTPSSPIPNSVSARTREDFERFWQAYPNKVGKPVAMKSFERIAKHDFAYSLDEILEGLERYKRSIGDKPWLNPSTFLNQRRWEDQPAEAQARAGPPQKPKTVTYATMLAELKGYGQNDETSFDFNGKTIDADPVGNSPGPRFGKIALGN